MVGGGGGTVTGAAPPAASPNSMASSLTEEEAKTFSHSASLARRSLPPPWYDDLGMVPVAVSGGLNRWLRGLAMSIFHEEGM